MDKLNQLANQKPNLTVQNTSLIGLLTQFVITFGIALICLCFFECLRGKKPSIYSPNSKYRKKFPYNHPDKRIFGWLRVIFWIDDHQIDGHIGADAAFFLLFHKHASMFFFILLVAGLIFLIPANYSGQNGQVGLDRISIANIEPGSAFLWLHFFITVASSFIFFGFLVRVSNLFLELNKNHRSNQIARHSITSRSIMLENLPPSLQSDSALLEYMAQVSNCKKDELQVYLCRDVAQMNQLVSKYNHWVGKLEGAYCQLKKKVEKENGNCWKQDSPPTVLMDMRNEDLESGMDSQSTLTHSQTSLTLRRKKNKDQVTYFWNLLKQHPDFISHIDPKYIPKHKKGVKNLNALDFYTTKMELKKDKIEHDRERFKDIYNPTCCAFVTFEDPKLASMVSQSVITSQPRKSLCQLAPEPRDILWQNVPLIKHAHIVVRKFIITTLTALLIFFWLIPSGLVVSLTSLSQLSQWIPGLGAFAEKSYFFKAIVVDVLPTILTNILVSLVPSILYWFSQVEVPLTKSQLERRTIAKYFTFLLFNVFLVFTLGGTALKSISQIIMEPASIIAILANQLPNNSNFFIYYIVLGISSFAFELLQIPKLIFSFLPFLYPTPRQRSQFYAPQPPLYYLTVPTMALFFVITVCYMPISPIICAFGFVYFGVWYLGWKYQLVYVYWRQYESGAIYWKQLIDHLFLGVFLSQLTMMGLLVLKAAPLQAILLVPLFCFSVYYRTRLHAFIKQRSKYFPLENIYEATTKRQTLANQLNDLNAEEKEEEEDVKGYLHQQSQWGEYIDPDLKEELERVWLPKEISFITQREVKWSSATLPRSKK